MKPQVEPAGKPGEETAGGPGIRLVIGTCRRRDLQIARLALESLHRHLEVERAIVAVPGDDLSRFRRTLPDFVELVNEDKVIPGVTRDRIKAGNPGGRPESAGWYLQQFLKLALVAARPSDEPVLVWDMDTVLLRPLVFVDGNGRALMTESDEWHEPYFRTIRKILGIEVRTGRSFIAQHQVMEPPIVRSLLARFGQLPGGCDPWPIKLLKSLPDQGTNLFSEYETHGQFLLACHPDRMQWRQLPWLRSGASLTWFGKPSRRLLAVLARDYAFAAFERRDSRLRRIVGPAVDSIRAGRRSGPDAPGETRRPN